MGAMGIDGNHNNNTVYNNNNNELIVIIEVYFNDGSISITNNVKLSKPLNYEYRTTVTTRVDLIGEDSIYVYSEILIPAGSTIGTSVTTLDKDYGKLLDTSDVSSVLHNITDSNITVVNTSKKVIYEKLFRRSKKYS